jgi:hypothetical protein
MEIADQTEESRRLASSTPWHMLRVDHFDQIALGMRMYRKRIVDAIDPNREDKKGEFTIHEDVNNIIIRFHPDPDANLPTTGYEYVIKNDAKQLIQEFHRHKKNGGREHVKFSYDESSTPVGVESVYYGSNEMASQLLEKTVVLQHQAMTHAPSTFSLSQFNLPDFPSDGEPPPAVLGLRHYIAMALCLGTIVALVLFSRILVRRRAGR